MMIGIPVYYTQVYKELVQAYDKNQYNVFVLEGSSRSSKTHSVIQFFVKYAYENIGQPKRVAICRLKGTWIEATILFDFIHVLMNYGLYDVRNHNKTRKIIKLFDTEFWFMGLDDPQKVHGFESDAFFINEGIEAGYDDYAQLMQRCKGFAVIDYNPSETEHWIYDRVLKREKTWYSHSTFQKNKFISANAKAQILSYEPTDENYAAGTADERKWKIYGLGQPASIEGLIFDNWEIVKEIPVWAKRVHRYGLDFGYTNDPTAIVDSYWSQNDNIRWLDEVCYETGLVNPDVGRKIIDAGLKTAKGYADTEQKSIEEISRMGINIHPAKKPPGSRKVGVDIMKRHRFKITERSINLIREIKNYTWMQNKDGVWLNEPQDGNDHCMDATRYIAFMEWSQENAPENKAKTASAMAAMRAGTRRRLRR